MNTCKTCSDHIDSNDKYVLCSGACNSLFHVNCAGLNTTNFKAWSSNVGLLWFCDTCRVNFNPTVMDRESHILRALRDLLIRVDSMDLRLGQYAENMKTMNSLLSLSHVRRESNVDPRFHSAGVPTNAAVDFHHSIDRLNLDSSLHSSLGNIFDEPTTSEASTASVVRHVAALTTTTTAMLTPITKSNDTTTSDSTAIISTATSTAPTAMATNTQ